MYTFPRAPRGAFGGVRVQEREVALRNQHHNEKSKAAYWRASLKEFRQFRFSLGLRVQDFGVWGLGLKHSKVRAFKPFADSVLQS